MEIVAAIIGSGVLSVVISTVLSSRKFERPYEKISILNSELKLVEELEQKASVMTADDCDRVAQSRAHVLSRIARSQVSSRIAEVYLPRRGGLNTLIAVFGFACLILGSAVLGVGIWGDSADLIAPGFSVVFAGLMAVVLGVASEKAEVKIRMSIMDAFDVREFGGSSDLTVGEISEEPRRSLRLNWIERQIVPRDIQLSVDRLLAGRVSGG